LPFWKFTNKAATETASESVELEITGDIIDDEDAWLYEWFGIQAASPNAFRAALKEHAGKDIVVRINSYGGSVWAAAGMYNALMDHKNTGGKITTRTDQKAMSAATIPYMAGDERLMGAVDMLMIHNPLTEVYGYASDLRRVADVLDEVKETIINAYAVTGRSRTKLSELMDNETYMSAKTAIKDGFATGMIGEAEVAPANVSDFSFNRAAILNSTGDGLKRMVALQKKPPDPPPEPPADTAALKARMALELNVPRLF
jgi:ATP-dependent Clp protease protease subunit